MTLIYKTAPFNYQREILERSWDKEYYGLFMEMGTGKSKVVIDTIYNLYMTKRIRAVLYVAKKGEYANFDQYQIPAHFASPEKLESVVYMGYSRKDHVAAIKSVLDTSGTKLKIFSMNIEAIRAGRGFEIAQLFSKTYSKLGLMIVIDESTCIKERKSIQTRSMMKLRTYARYRRIMTGTVMSNTPSDVWSQSMFLEPKALGIKSLSAFKAEYHIQEQFHYGARSFIKTIGTKNIADLRQRMDKFSTSLKKTDCLDLPEKMYERVKVPLTSDQVHHYRNLADLMMTQIKPGEFITAANSLSMMIKLHQVVVGQIRDEIGGYHIIKNNRIQACLDVLENILEEHEKVVVWSNFVAISQELVVAIAHRWPTVHLRASMTTEERQSGVHRFKNGDVRVFVGNPQSSGFGLTLTEASYCVYFSNTYNYEYRIQSEDRIHRIGQPNKCTYIDLHSPGTVEDRIFEAILTKGAMRDSFMTKDKFLELVRLEV